MSGQDPSSSTKPATFTPRIGTTQLQQAPTAEDGATGPSGSDPSSSTKPATFKPRIGTTQLQQAPTAGDGATGSSLAPTFGVIAANSQATIAVVLVHGLNSNPSTFIGKEGASWATELNQSIAPLIGEAQVEVLEVGWQTSPLNSANVSTTIQSTTPELLKTLVRAVNGRKWVGVGHSMGGMALLSAVGLGHKETTEKGGNPTISNPTDLQNISGLLTGNLGIFRLASPGQGSPWALFGLAVATAIPGANTSHIAGLVPSSQDQQQITELSNVWFEARKQKGKTVNVFSAQETKPVIVDYDGSAFDPSSQALTNSMTVQMPNESHTSAPKAPAGSDTGNILVAGVVFCINGKPPPGFQGVAGTSEGSGITSKVQNLMPKPETLRTLNPLKGGNQDPSTVGGPIGSSFDGGGSGLPSDSGSGLPSGNG